ncbi:kynureninase [Catalinimonas alkaloidigena]|uniref:kynureninase n=1 Tax=Catalinimonas alkaloidigena TaxID=1075417 RepID=UPI0024067BB9|nr:kynureninase [Catalinimonas alkaloidigena]MDF9800960.1 kynureninase [Catalinimonas alkaloidigena]
MPKLLDTALQLDKSDLLKHYREQFHIPKDEEGKAKIYFCGNSLGLQPKKVTQYLQESLHKWQSQGVEGHFEEPAPWLTYHILLKASLAHITGAHEHEVVAMNNLTTNLHLMMVSFYRPSGQRYKIMLEAGAFPSDQYAVESQLRFRGYDPEDAIIEVQPKPGEETLHMDDIIARMHEHKEEIALVLFPGVQYYTGQYIDIQKITEAAHEIGAKAGFDLAHTVGNIPLQLHDWNVDFAVWCSYKYLNSGPGSNGGVFVHEHYASDTTLTRFAGWWGHDEKERFQMKKGFRPMYGADGWQLSNVNILSASVQRFALEMIAQAGMENLRKKSIQLTDFLESCIQELDPEGQQIKIITPSNPEERGCQLSMFVLRGGKHLFQKLTEASIVVDWREPNVIRVAPNPLYNTFEEVYRFYEILKSTLHAY